MEKVFKLYIFGVLILFAAFNVFSGDFTLSSTSFDDGGKILPKNANYGVYAGDNISPQFSWSNAPKGVKSFAITCIDIAPIANNWVHWFVFNIPSSVTYLNQGDSDDGSIPENSIQMNNSFGVKGYSGPQPPPGSGTHTYVFTVYALDIDKLVIYKNFMNYDEIQSFLKPHIISSAVYTGTFER